MTQRLNNFLTYGRMEGLAQNSYSNAYSSMVEFVIDIYDQQFAKPTIGWKKQGKFTQLCCGAIADPPATTNYLIAIKKSLSCLTNEGHLVYLLSK